MAIPVDVPAGAVALTVFDAAEALQCNPATVRKLLRNGTLRSVKAGRLVRIPRTALEEFLAGHAAGGGGEAA